MASGRGAGEGSSWENPIDLRSDDEDDHDEDEVEDGDDDNEDEDDFDYDDDEEDKRRRQEALIIERSEECRRRFRTEPPRRFFAVYERAMRQRFCVLDRLPGGDELCPEETFLLAGSTGNVYTVLARVLHAPYHLIYQPYLLSSELRSIFCNAWVIEDQPSYPPDEDDSSSEGEARRRPIEGDCSICFCELQGDDPQPIVWCRAECGQNIHRQCMDTWLQSSEGPPRCPMCRCPWEAERTNTFAALENAILNEGYANVGLELGMPLDRDTRSYSRWFTGQNRRGW
ncbi:hypothetical protein CP532_3477 [Ophiocordyceps camponoti-leonardi (nom. inval.)]|nr:hypothetical protein CP532_3477 [Ophiocordyceps camponoti-leonardi (nom. inval.)]